MKTLLERYEEKLEKEDWELERKILDESNEREWAADTKNLQAMTQKEIELCRPTHLLPITVTVC